MILRWLEFDYSYFLTLIKLINVARQTHEHPTGFRCL